MAKPSRSQFFTDYSRYIERVDIELRRAGISPILPGPDSSLTKRKIPEVDGEVPEEVEPSDALVRLVCEQVGIGNPWKRFEGIGEEDGWGPQAARWGGKNVTAAVLPDNVYMDDLLD